MVAGIGATASLPARGRGDSRLFLGAALAMIPAMRSIPRPSVTVRSLFANAFVLALALWVLPVSPVSAACGGDCGGDGEVTVDEVLTLVNIALGNVDISGCTAGDLSGEGEITVDEIITAVQHALDGCPAGTTESWILSDFRLEASTCPTEIDQLVADQIGRDSPCLVEFTFSPGEIATDDCDGNRNVYPTDEERVIRQSDSQSATVGDCMFVLMFAYIADLRQSPSAVSYDVGVDFSGTCPVESCESRFLSTLTRQEPAASASGGSN